MKNILVIGAGRSAPTLIKYLLEQSGDNDWRVKVGDILLDLASERINGHENGRAIAFDVLDSQQRQKEISVADVVVSMLPPSMHMDVAKDCVELGKHMVTASYVSDEMNDLNEAAKKKGVVLLNEIGVDPGLDHLSSMDILEKIKAKGGLLTSFESFTGGLVAPESDNNPWNYKFTWNPRNVVLAGQGVVKFIQEGKYKYIPYHKVFNRIEKININGYGSFEGYANRDSLKYREVYGIDDIPTLYRGTLRRPGFCRAWDLFVQLGATDDSYTMENTEKMTHREFINSFVFYHPGDSVKLKVAYHMGIGIESDELEKLTWLGLFDDTVVGLINATPAQILQHILEKKWTLEPDDKDMIVMMHRVFYKINGSLKRLISELVVKGDDSTYTAMAKTVGLPMAIATKHIANGVINSPGVLLPITKEIYEPTLKELSQHGIEFVEREEEVG
ncbi:MAG TPA: saccharopine dehydrogenase [Flavobacteriales bacterium]|nr:saccharopine dehydrogenase [Flavobacteriales bacterium]HIO68676.1 saccharopine dehydrogenase [Flavobacteriales bacterium]